MKNIRIYKKGILIGLSSLMLTNVTACSKEQEVVDTKNTVSQQQPDWVKKRMQNEQNNDQTWTQEEIEKAAVDAFDSWSTSIESSFQNLQDTAMMQSAKEKIATTFITMTDILFYGEAFEYSDGKTITISELSETAKQKLELIYSTIDSKIESYWPGYKEEIEKGWNLGKGYICDKANRLKLYLLDQISNHMSEENYEKCGEYFRMFKEQSKTDLENGKDLLQELWNQGVTYADEKYQDFKEEHENEYQK